MSPLDLPALVEDANSLQPNTKRAYGNAVRRWLAYAGDDPVNWTPAVAQAFYNDLVTETSVTHANSVVTGGVSFALRRAVAMGYPDVRDVTAAVDKKKASSVVLDEDEGGGRALTTTEANKLLAVGGRRLIDLRDRSILLLGFYTGMRRASLVDVDLRRVAVRGAYVTLDVAIKGGTRYDVPLSIDAWALTETYRTALVKSGHKGPMFPAVGQRRPTRHDPIGKATVSPRAITTHGLYLALKRRAEAAGITDFHPHMLRHTFVTWCRLAKVEDYVVEVVTGHKGGRGIADRVYFDRDAAATDATKRCYEAVKARLT